MALARGSARVVDFNTEAVNDPAVQRLRQRVTAQLDASLPTAACVVTVTLMDGRSGRARVDAARGSATRPLSDTELEAKFRSNAPGSLAQRRVEAVWGLDAAPDIRPLMALMAQSGAG